MSTAQEQLQATVDSLGVGKFNVADGMIPGSITKAAFLAAPEKYADEKVVAYCTVVSLIFCNAMYL